jgi:hypothetical protein
MILPRPYQHEAVQACLMAHVLPTGTMTQSSAARDTVLRMALVCWCVDVDNAMTPSQRAWLAMRLKEQTPFTPIERARLRGPLLCWCRRCGGERLAALVGRQFREVTLELQGETWDVANNEHAPTAPWWRAARPASG